jgi:Transposase DDE domain group 1
MQTECSADLFGFAPVEGRKVVAGFDGGRMTSDAGAMLLGAADKRIGLIERVTGCFTDYRDADLVEHTVAGLVGQRVFGIALGYEDLIDHEQLRHDPVMAVLGGKLEARRADCAPLAGKSTLNRLELSREEPTRYHKIGYDAAAIEGLFVDRFLDAHSTAPTQITRDLDATDDPLHGHQEGRFFHGYITTPTAICRSMCSAAGICWPPSCARPILMPVPAALRRWRGSSPGSASAGPGCASCCAPLRALPARG